MADRQSFSASSRVREIREPLRFRAGSHARPAGLADLRSHRRRHRRSGRRTRPPGAARMRQGHQGRPGATAARAARAIDQATGMRTRGPILFNSRGTRMQRTTTPKPSASMASIRTDADIHETRRSPELLCAMKRDGRHADDHLNIGIAGSVRKRADRMFSSVWKGKHVGPIRRYFCHQVARYVSFAIDSCHGRW
jgi:hypothetical protein